MNQPVKDFYDSNAAIEQERLNLPLCRIEFVSTLHLIDKYFPKQGRVCDIGGGPGRYAIELIRRGYVTTLIDLSDDAIQLARTRLDELGLNAEQVLVGDAQDLGMLPSESFDAAYLPKSPSHTRTLVYQRKNLLRRRTRLHHCFCGNFCGRSKLKRGGSFSQFFSTAKIESCLACV